jgi:hypothetical protein
MRRRQLWVAVGMAVGVTGCQGAPEGDAGYLLLDRGAREAGFAVEGAEGRVAPVMPMELTSDSEVSLVGPTGRVALSGAAGELLHVQGADGKMVSRELGADVDGDRLILEGSEESAHELAALLGGKVVEGENGTWEIHGAGVLAEATQVRAPKGLTQVLLADQVGDQEAPEQAGRVVGFDPGNARFALQAQLASREALDAVGVRSVMDKLPPAVTCSDPAAGVWMSQDYDARYGDWYIFTLRVSRVIGSSTELTGDIEAHAWDGGPLESTPPACEEGGANHWTVKMTATGTIKNGQMSFGGTFWRPDRTFCGSSPTDHGYNLDQFTGALDGSTFQAKNNDGGRMVEQATPFRRVKCQ